MFSGNFFILLLPTVLLLSCTAPRSRSVALTGEGLTLDRVVLYQNGVGYFERSGEVDGDVLTIKVRKDQINDLLKSLTVVDRSSGQALSVSLPLNPADLPHASRAELVAGKGSLAQMLEALRGSHVEISGKFTLSGRILMVEHSPQGSSLVLLDGENLHTLKVKDISSLKITDRDITLQLAQRLDAESSEGMFQQVQVQVRLAGAEKHDVQISYVVAAPRWKPTYRIVLDDKNPKKALLQAWAVVDNTSGENWDDVRLSLTSGAPLAFRYDLHSPETPWRQDLTRNTARKSARVALGETSFADEESFAEAEMDDMDGLLGLSNRGAGYAAAPKSISSFMKKKSRRSKKERKDSWSLNQLQQSTSARSRSKRVSGLTRFDLQDRVTLPEGSATMVALINEVLEGEQLFLFEEGGSGSGYEQNPYRVVRFRNSTDFVLEPGPISIYSGGSFVGEGLSEAVASKALATIPFAVEPEITVRKEQTRRKDQRRLFKIVRGVMEVETYHKTVTTWTVQAAKAKIDRKILAKQNRMGGNYKLMGKIEGVEELDRHYLIPIVLPVGESKVSLTVTEQTPVRSSLTIWEGTGFRLLADLLKLENLSRVARKKIQPLVEKRQKMGALESEISGLKKKQRELDERARELRNNLNAIRKDKNARSLRSKLTKRLEEFSLKGDKIGRRVVELNTNMMELRFDLEEELKGLSIEKF